MKVDRRDLFRILGAGIASGTATAQHQHAAAAAGTVPTSPRVFSAEEFAVLQRLLEILLPADDHSPSARDAGVGMYIDTTLHYADDKERAIWREPVRVLGKTFLDMDETAATEVMRGMAENEDSFFVLLKSTAINSYYISDGGHQSLGYRGDTAIQTFPGCTHADHRA